MKKRIHLFVKQSFGLIMGLFIFISCQQISDILPTDPSSEFQRDGSPMILGKQLENPYSVENMKKALETNVCYTTSITPRNLNEFPQDRVSGYTIAQIEQGLRGARSWDQWRDNMIIRHSNATENRLNELFANWY